MSTHPFAVVGDSAALPAVVAWYARVSGGRAALLPEVLPLHEPRDSWAAYADRGGLGPPPRNSQVMMEVLLASLDRSGAPAAAHGVMVATPPGAGFAPHAWRLRRGGFWLEDRRWVRRYAIVPADAPVGTVAHELGHLVFGWPDHDRRSRVGADCLMSTGAAASWPARPCAPSRLDAGWIEAVPATRTMTVAELADAGIVRSRKRLIELGPSGDVLVFEGRDLVARVGAEPGRPVLAVVASALSGTG
ncbi:MAG: hypothetical protein ACRDJ5_06675 [Actinomycetota bacterium]